MTIGPDIKEAIVEIGTLFTIERESGDITGEYLSYKSNAQVTKPFIREFFLDAELCYDTEGIGGDIIKFNATGTRYIIMNRTPIQFEDTVIKWETTLYKSNTLINVYRQSLVRNSQTYRMDVTWSLVEYNRYALITSPLYGIDLETDEQLGLLGLQVHEMYVPTSYDIKAHDRVLVIGENEYFRVEAVKKRRYEGVNVLEIGYDTRATSTTTSSSTSTSTTTTTA